MQRPDGLYEITLADGTKVSSALPPHPDAADVSQAFTPASGGMPVVENQGVTVPLSASDHVPPPEEQPLADAGSLYDPNAAAAAGGGPPRDYYPPARVIPGEMQDRQHVIELGASRSPEARAASDAAFDKQREAAKTAYDAAQARSKLETSVADAEAEALADATIDARLRRQAHDDRANALRESMRKQREERAARAKQMGPAQYYKDRGVAAGVLAAIAASAGAYASTMTGAPNFALEIINRNMDLAMQAQRDEIDALDGNIAAADNELARLYEQYDDRERAEREWLITGLDVAKMQAQRALASVQDQEQAANFQATIAAIDQEQAALLAKDDQVVAQRIVRERTPDRVVGGPPSLDAVVKRKRLEKELAQLEGGGDANPLAVRDYGVAYDRESAQAARALVIARDDFAGALAEADRLYKKRPEGWRARVEALRDTIGSAHAKLLANGLAATAEQEKAGEAMASKVLPGVTGEGTEAVTQYFAPDAEQRRKARIREAQRRANNGLKQYVVGYKPEAQPEDE